MKTTMSILHGLSALCLTISLSAYGVTDEEVRQTCTACHNLTLANGFNLTGATSNVVGPIALKTLTGWTGTVTRMQGPVLGPGTGAVLALGSTVADYASYLYAAQSGSPATVALSSLAVTPINSTVNAGQTKQYTATGTLDDNSTRELTAGGFPTIKAMNLGLESHTATRLGNGKVLIAGGSTESMATAAAELYDPGTGIFSPTGPMTIRRWAHVDVLLGTGQILLVGGHTGGQAWLGSGVNGIYLNTAELYDSATGTFSATTGTMSSPRAWASIVALGTGASDKVLIAGGNTGLAVIATAELYDPTTKSFSTIRSMITPRSHATATLLKNGKVLIAGGWTGTASIAAAELYDPARGTFKATAGPMTTARSRHTATLLASGKVLIAGGMVDSTETASVEIYDPATNTFTALGPLARPRWWHTATLLENGKILMAGGRNRFGTSDPVFELYDPVTGTSAFSGVMEGRWIHTATLLQNGQVLITGGLSSNNPAYASAEIYTPTIWSSGNASIATINSTGLASSGTSAGTTSIIATSGSTSGSTSLLNSGSDMIVTAVSGNVTSVTRGSSFTITSSTKNQGNASSGVTTQTGFYLSTDATITSSDKLLGSSSISSLPTGNSVQTSTTVTVPSNQARGTYYLGAIADYTSLVTELNESNNSFTGTTIQVK